MLSTPLRVPGFARLDEYLGLWAIEPTAFRSLWEAAARMDLKAHVEEEQPPLKSQMEMVPARNGKSIAVVPVLGVMMKQRSSMGGTSTIQLRRDIRNAAADPNVSSILLAIESPGGTTAGLDDLAAEVRAARKIKPVWAHVDDLTASAAYWTASQAERITANSPTALVGSIGTILTIYDQSAAAEKEGVKALVFSTGPLKGAGTPGTEVNAQQQAYFQGIVNGVQAEFDKAVKTGRKLSDAQLTEVRSGAVWKATEAQTKGLIDGVQPLSKTLDELSRAADGGGSGRAAAVFAGGMAPAPVAAVAPGLLCHCGTTATVYTQDKGTETVRDGWLFTTPGLARTYCAKHAPGGAIDIPTSLANHLPAVRVTPGANPEKRTMTFDAWLAANVPNHESLSAEQRDNLYAAYKTQQTPAPPPAVLPAQAPVAQLAPAGATSSLDDIIAAARAEDERKQQITGLVAQAITAQPAFLNVAESIGRQAIDGKWPVQRAELELLRGSRNVFGNGGQINLISRSKPEITGAVLEAAMCQRGGLEKIDKHYDEQTLSAAQREFPGGIGPQELIMHIAKAKGYRHSSYKSNDMAAIKAALRDQDGYDLRAEVGPSTYSLPNILANVMNKFVRTSFDAVDQTWRLFSAIRSVSDFKAISTLALTGDNTFEQLGNGGEIKSGTLGETAYTNQANTYAKMLGINRQDLINDDSGALTGASRRLGRGGALKLNDVFWTAFLNNSSFFTTGRANADSGNDTLMDLTGIANGWAMFQNQTDPDTKPLGVTPKIILVPPALYPAAWTLTNSTVLNLATSTAASTGTASPWAGMFKIVTSPYLANSAYTGYSAAAWYMLADPNDMPVIEVAFLNGKDTPTVETDDMDFDRLGIAFRGYFDFGVALQEYRGGVRMAGA